MKSCILAGGKNTRMNSKIKGLLPYNGESFTKRTLEVLSEYDPFIISNTPNEFKKFKRPIYEDLIKEIGPLGGIYTALKKIKDNRCIIVGSDMPLLKKDIIEKMIKYKEFDIVVPRIDGKIEMLCGIYNKKIMTQIEKMIKTKDYKLQNLLKETSVKFVEFDKIYKECFVNINTENDYKKLTSRKY